MKYINDKITSLDITKGALNEGLKKLTIRNRQGEPLKDVIGYIDRWDELNIDEKKSICKYFIKKYL